MIIAQRIKREALTVPSHLDHRLALAHLTGRHHPTVGSLPGRLAQKLIASGFVWFVSMSFVARFKYHAAISYDSRYQDCQLCPVRTERYGEARVMYDGDLPDFAIQRSLAAIEVGIRAVTIHSMEPLAVSLQLPRVDPVLIGWRTCPYIQTDEKGLLCATNGKSTGVVLAVFDGEKEIAVI